MPQFIVRPIPSSSPVNRVQRIDVGIHFKATDRLCVELRSMDSKELATLYSWVGQEIDPHKTSDLIPAPQSLAWRDIRRNDPHGGESYARQQTLYVHIYAPYEPRAEHRNTHELVQERFSAWLEDRTNRHVQSEARGITEGGDHGRAMDRTRDTASSLLGSTSSRRAAAPPGSRARQMGFGSVCFLAMTAIVAFSMWQLTVIASGLKEVGRVELGPVATVVGGFPMGGNLIEPTAGSSRPGGRMFLMVQVNGSYFRLYEPLVVHRNAALVLRTFKNGRRFICNTDNSVCARTADVSREIEATQKATTRE